MAILLPTSLKRLFRRDRNAGFTLLEVLVAALIGGMIVSGLMYLVIELMSADQREAAREETHQDMQNALDYISADLREAVYVYEGECLAGNGALGDPDFCPGLVNHLPANLTDDSVPVLAFWKQEEYPEAIIDDCAGGNADDGTNCLNGRSYTLIVYSLSQGENWDGNAQLTRYVLAEFNQAGIRNGGYVNPGATRDFRRWPYLGDENLQAGRPDNTPDVLVDFVDDGSGQNNRFGEMDEVCPANYEASPTEDLLADTGFNGVRSFYACIKTFQTAGGEQNTRSDRNSEVVIRLRGNPAGRPGVNSNDVTGDVSFLTPLETRVLSRGVVGKNPIE
jgi:prepilin-type N-terminal cleavage/methylation domain-containing protein